MKRVSKSIGNPKHPVYLEAMITLLQQLCQRCHYGNLEQALYEKINGDELPMGRVMNSMRLALVGAGREARIHEIIYLIGVERRVFAVRTFIEEVRLNQFER